MPKIFGEGGFMNFGKSKREAGAEKDSSQLDEWERREASAIGMHMNRLTESMYMAFVGGPKGIDVRFQSFDLTDKDLQYLQGTLPKEEALYLTGLKSFLDALEQYIDGSAELYVNQPELRIRQGFYQKRYGTEARTRVRRRLSQLLVGTSKQ